MGLLTFLLQVSEAQGLLLSCVGRGGAGLRSRGAQSSGRGGAGRGGAGRGKAGRPGGADVAWGTRPALNTSWPVDPRTGHSGRPYPGPGLPPPLPSGTALPGFP